MSALTTEFLRGFGIKVVRSSVYHPQSNPVERMHRTLKRILRVLCLESGPDWEKILPQALFALRTATHGSTGFSPAELVHGRNLRTPLMLLYEQLTEETQEEDSVVSYVFELMNRMKRCQELAVHNMQEAKEKQKICIFSNQPGCTDLAEHDIELESESPIIARPYRMTPRQSDILKAEVNKMLEMKVIEPGDSDFTSPMILVEAPGKDPRPCIDYRRLNKCDASNLGIGIVLSQVNEEGDEHPIMYLSRKFSPAEQKYSTTERECAAIVYAVQNYDVI
ncbi:hypothetical protein JTE90_014891 [Oedothorax gibbosus]|uniref:Reverse transcriptase RNase H-like domain-containing protein n=1 Tax=Oedothorax gibbosus TaxID=931172 RepID=A0AAV6VLE3_9ARAC|nr:hypothetical protein JTE90_014891 [Oedothorax gibbosus]